MKRPRDWGGCTEDWDFSRFVPDAVIVNLGTNDSGVFCDKEELREGMKALLGYDPAAVILRPRSCGRTA